MSATNQWLARELKRHGVSRRDFLGFCATMASALALPDAAAAQIAKAVLKTEKPILVWLEFQDCAGNTESFLRATRPSAADVVLDVLSLDYHETIMAAAGHQAEANLARTVKERPGAYIAVIEGSIPTGANGGYCTIGGRSALDIAREVCGSAAATIAIGTCAAFGGIPAAAPNPTSALGVADAVPGVRNLINLSACPANVENLTALARALPDVQDLAAARSLPPPALRVWQVHPRQLRAAGALRRRSVRRGVGRRRPSRRLLPLQDGVQGTGRLPELSQRALERRHELADRMRPPVHRLQRARLLGSHDAVLPAPGRHTRASAPRPTSTPSAPSRSWVWERRLPATA